MSHILTSIAISKTLQRTLLAFLVLGAVNLQAQNESAESATETKQVEQGEDESGEDESEDNLFRKVQQLVESGDIRDAVAMIDEHIQQTPEKDFAMVQRSLSFVGAGFERIRNPREAYKQFRKLYQFQIDRLPTEGDKVRLSSSVRACTLVSRRMDKQDEIKKMVEDGIVELEKYVDMSVPSQLLFELSNLRSMKAAVALTEERRDEAAAILQTDNEVLAKLYQDHSDDELLFSAYVRNLMESMLVNEAPEKQAELFNQHQEIVTARIESMPKNISYASQYLRVLNLRAQQMVAESPDVVLTMIEEGEKVLTGVIQANPEESRQLASQIPQLAQLKGRALAQLVVVELIDKPSPEFDAQTWVNGDELQLSDLQGKVVLLDFWAMWCGPCIRAFPDLKKFQETYAAEGFQIVGATRHYNFTWNEEEDQPARSEAEVPAAEENSAIKRFVEKYELPYPSMVMPQGSEMSRSFGVASIPHVVLIDRKGNVRMVKVGTSETSGDEIEAKIRELLLED